MNTNSDLRIEEQEAFIDVLASEGYALYPNFLKKAECQTILNHIAQLKEEDEMKKAGIGKQLNFTVKKNLRGDFIQWIKKDEEPLEVINFLAQIDALKSLINRTCYLSLKDFESHYTFYPEQTRYIKHRDRFQHNAHRLISVVCYLAEDWKAEDGGQLVIYKEDGTQVEIIPQQGLLACFKSEMEHEVLLTQRERYSITGWMLDQPAKLTFL